MKDLLVTVAMSIFGGAIGCWLGNLVLKFFRSF